MGKNKSLKRSLKSKRNGHKSSSDYSSNDDESIKDQLDSTSVPFAKSTTKTAAAAVAPDLYQRFQESSTLIQQYLPLKLQAFVNPYIERVLKVVYESVVPIVDQIMYWEILVDVTLVTGAIFNTWIVGYFRLSWLFVPIIWISTLYAMKTAYFRLKSRLHFEAVRVLSKTKLVTDSETMEWLNQFLQKFWPMFEPWISEQVIEQINSVLDGAKPSFVYDIKLTTFTLGAAAPRIETVKSYVNTDDEIVSMDWHLTFTPASGSHLRNSKIILMTWLGKGMATVPVPVEVSDVAFNGIANVQLTLGETFPHVRLVDLSLRELPDIDFTLKPLKAMDLLNTPLLSQFIIDLINGQLAAFIVAPQKLHVDVETLLAGPEPQKQVIGVLKIVVHEGEALKNTEAFGGSSDPYVSVFISDREVAVTRVIRSSLNPFYNETFYVLVSKFMLMQPSFGSDAVEFIVKDFNKVKKDAFMGRTKILHLSELIDSVKPVGRPPSQMSLATASSEPVPPENPTVEPSADVNVLQDDWQPLFADISYNASKFRGALRTSISYYPIQDDAFSTQAAFKSVHTASEPVLSEDGPSTGILRISIIQAKELDTTKSLQGKLNPLAVVELNGKRVFKTKLKKRNNNPNWSETVDAFVSDIVNASVKISIKDQRELAVDPVIGFCTLNVFELLSGPPDQPDWFKLFGAGSGRVRVHFEFAPISIPMSVNSEVSSMLWFTKELRSLSGYPDTLSNVPIGVLELHLEEARNLRSNDLSTGKSDPYVVVTLNGQTLHRTKIIPENLNPKWHEAIYLIVHTSQDRLDMQVLDYNAFSNDVCLGKVVFRLSELLSDLNKSVKPPAIGDSAGDSTGVAAAESTTSAEDGKLAEQWLDLKDEKKGVVLTEGRGSLKILSAFLPVKPFTEADADWGGCPCGILRVRLLELKVGVKTKDRLFVEAFLDDKQRVFQSTVKKKGSSVVFDDVFECFISDTGTSNIDFRLLESSGAAADSQVNRHKASKARCVATLSILTIDILSQRIGFDKLMWLPFSADAGAAVGRTSEDVKSDEGSLAQSAILAGSSIFNSLSRSRETMSIVSSGVSSPISIDQVDAKNLGPVSGKFGFGFLPVQVGGRSSRLHEQGVVELNVVKAINLPAVDRQGIDPYLIISVNGRSIHRTAVFKRELNPVFDEALSFPVLQRNKAVLEIMLYDYNKFETNKQIGLVSVPLSKISGELAAVTELYDFVDPVSGNKIGGQLELSLGFFSQRVANLEMPSIDVADNSNLKFKSNSGTLERVGKVGKAIVSAPVSILTRKRHGIPKDGFSLGKMRFASSSSKQPVVAGTESVSHSSLPAGDDRTTAKPTVTEPETDNSSASFVIEDSVAGTEPESIPVVDIDKSAVSGRVRVESQSLSKAAQSERVEEESKVLAEATSFADVSGANASNSGIISLKILGVKFSEPLDFKLSDCYVTVVDVSSVGANASGKHEGVVLGKTHTWKASSDGQRCPVWDDEFHIAVSDFSSSCKLQLYVKEKHALFSDTTRAQGVVVPFDILRQSRNDLFTSTGVSASSSNVSSMVVQTEAVPLAVVRGTGKRLDRRLSIRSNRSIDSRSEASIGAISEPQVFLSVSVKFEHVDSSQPKFASLASQHRRRSTSVVSLLI